MTLLRRLIPALSWIPWLPVGVIVCLIAWSIAGLQPDFNSRQLYIRAGLLLAALGLSFAFDDPAAPTTDPVPSPLRTRRLLRLVLSAAPWAAAVAVVLWSGVQGGGEKLPVTRLVLEGTTMAVWGLAISAFTASRWDDEPGKIASVALVALYAASWAVPERWKPWALPSDSRWETDLPWWWVALGFGTVIVVVSSWDTRGVAIRRVFHLGSRSSILAPWSLASRTTKPTSSPASSQKPPVSR